MKEKKLDNKLQFFSFFSNNDLFAILYNQNGVTKRQTMTKLIFLNKNYQFEKAYPFDFLTFREDF